MTDKKSEKSTVAKEFGPLFRGLVKALTMGIEGGFKSALESVAPTFRRRYVQASFSDKLVGPKPGMDSLFSITLGQDLDADVNKKEYLASIRSLEKQCEGMVSRWQDDYIEYLKEKGFEFPESEKEKKGRK